MDPFDEDEEEMTSSPLGGTTQHHENDNVDLCSSLGACSSLLFQSSSSSTAAITKTHHGQHQQVQYANCSHHQLSHDQYAASSSDYSANMTSVGRAAHGNNNNNVTHASSASDDPAAMAAMAMSPGEVTLETTGEAAANNCRPSAARGSGARKRTPAEKVLRRKNTPAILLTSTPPRGMRPGSQKSV